MVFNYVVGTSLSKDEQYKKVLKKQLLTIGVISNIGLLGYFKYSDVFISNVNFILNIEKVLING